MIPTIPPGGRQFGFGDADFADGGSDRLVDALVCRGEPAKIAAHVESHLAAGANHVCIQAFRADGRPGPDETLLESLAGLIN